MFDSLKQIFGQKEDVVVEKTLKARFVLEGRNGTGDYVFVSRDGNTGRAILYSEDGSFDFLRMENPDDIGTLSPEDRNLLTAKETYVSQGELKKTLDELMNIKADLSQLQERKAELERECDSLRVRVQSLEAERNANEVKVSKLEDAMRAAEAQRAEERHEVFETDGCVYYATGADESVCMKISEILQENVNSNIPPKAVHRLFDKYLCGRTDAPAGEYLRFAAFTLASLMIQENRKNFAGVSGVKEMNNTFLDDCADALRTYEPSDEYETLDLRGKVEILESVLQPLLSGYADRTPGSNPAAAM